MLWREEVSEQTRTWKKKNHLERVNKWQYTPSVFKGQIGHF